ncbi:DNA repair protein [Thalassococcus sp. S3]|nr:DNA repair protein [Thalassococcus sp. S3]
MSFGDTLFPNAGIAIQLALTAFLVGLCAFLPSNARIMALETSHRSFQIGMHDVTAAYARAHAQDRNSTFTLSSEFDSIRERLTFLRNHPDLDSLEPAVLEVAAQMSHVSRELADIYSTQNVARARDFLIQRQHELDAFEAQLQEAKDIASEMQRWHHRVSLEEDVAQSQLQRLREELIDVLPDLLDQPQTEETDDVGAVSASHAPDPIQTAPDEGDPFADDDRIVALLARRAPG